MCAQMVIGATVAGYVMLAAGITASWWRWVERPDRAADSSSHGR